MEPATLSPATHAMFSKYLPATHSLAHRVCSWLHAHRDEHLTSRDIATKFGCSSVTAVCSMLTKSVASGLLISHKDDSGRANLRFLNFYGSQTKQFERARDEGLTLHAWGELRSGYLGPPLSDL